MHSQHEKVEDLFSQALALPSGERTAFLEHACGQDAQLRERLTELLEATADAGQFLPDTPKDAPVEVGAGTTLEPLGTHIGRYKLLEKIGEGGCGVVYMAEQEEPVRRKVALKIIKAGMDSRQVIARFEAERQALAMMDHPNIAQFFDAGTIQTQSGEGRMQNPSADSALTTPHSSLSPGLPYFVMELVRGVRITDYCTQNNLPTRQRLDFFIQVCNAVQHAHQKGIIHRDLKPSNILVTENDGKPVPKVIDFGIAKATEGQLTDKTVFTQFAAFMGTPAYMSPEQAAMTSLDIDTRSDIYSLGVLLYELLTGTTPFDAQELLKAGFDEMRRVIRETEPEKPSTRLTQRLRRGPQSPSITPLSFLATDLDWIVMKCLEKDRERRYETANGLAADLERHLVNEPVAARPPSAAYRFRKMVRRNKTAFIAWAAVAVALMLGVGATALQAIRATRAEAQQRRLREESEQTVMILEEIMSSADPLNGGSSDTRVTTLMGQIRAKLNDGAANISPGVEASLRTTAGRIYVNLGRFQEGLVELQRALELQRNLYGDRDERLCGPLSYLSVALCSVGACDQALANAEESLRILRALHGEDSEAAAQGLVYLAQVPRLPQHQNEREQALRQALDIYERRGATNSENWSSAAGQLALVLRDQNKIPEALAILRPLVAADRRNLRTNQLTRGINLLCLAHTQVIAGESEEVETHYREALGIFYRLARPSSFWPNDCANRLLDFLEAQGDYHAFDSVLRDHDRYLRADPDLVVTVHLSHVLRMVSFYLRYSPSQATETKGALADLWPKAWAELRRDPSSVSQLDADRFAGFADALYRDRHYSEAETIYRFLMELYSTQKQRGSLIKAKASLARCLTERAWTDWTNSGPAGQTAGPTNSKAPSANSENSIFPLAPVTKAPLDRVREAAELLGECLLYRDSEPNGSRGKRGDTRSRLGAAVMAAAVMDKSLTEASRQTRLAEAETWLLDGQASMGQSTTIDPKYKRDGLKRLIHLYDVLKNTTQAAAWRAQLTDITLPKVEQEPISPGEASP